MQPIQSDLKKETSLIGMAYLNYIYQNDIDNRYFCESMLLMMSQVPAGTANPYVGLFTRKRAVTTMAALADVQLAFDYAIARTDPPEAKVRASSTRSARASMAAPAAPLRRHAGPAEAIVCGIPHGAAARRADSARRSLLQPLDDPDVAQARCRAP